VELETVGVLGREVKMAVTVYMAKLKSRMAMSIVEMAKNADCRGDLDTWTWGCDGSSCGGVAAVVSMNLDIAEDLKNRLLAKKVGDWFTDSVL
jgi:hypothetical protein